MADETGKVDIGSDLIRKSWMMEGLVQKQAISFWDAYRGTTGDAIIQTASLESAGTGHTVVIDRDGNISTKAVKGTTTAKGTGVQKKKFSDKVTVTDYRYVVDNGTKFNGKEIGDLSINEHADSRSKLADLWVRADDQAYFDLGQQDTGTAFGIDLGTTFTFDDFLDIEKTIKQGRGFSTTVTGIDTRHPLQPFYTTDGKPMWLFVIDTAMKNMLLKSTGAQQVFREADVRGNNNRLLSGVVGKVGNMVVVEAPDFFGTTEGTILDSEGYYQYDHNDVEIAGMRQYDSVNDVWTGEEGFSVASTLVSRGVVLGAGAFHKGNGMMPDYKWEPTDFEKFSESCLEVWCAAKNCKLLAENSDYNKAKVAGYDYGRVFVDVQVQTAS